MADDGEERVTATAADYAAEVILALVCYALQIGAQTKSL